MLNLGSKTIETEHLLLRKFTIQDAPLVFENWTSDAQVTQYISFEPHQTVDDTKRIITKWLREYEEDFNFNWVIILKSTYEPIGQISVVSKNIKHACCEVGYTLGSKWWKQGIMTEALKAVLSYLLEEVGFECVEAKHWSDNIASGRVMQKAGMKYDACLPERRISELSGKRVDLYIYSKMKNEKQTRGWYQQHEG